MANLKQRLHRKNASGSYDVIYLETSAAIVKRADGVTSVEDSLSAIEAWNPLRYEVKEDGSIASPFDPQLDAKTLEGHPASYFATASGMQECFQSVSEGKALIAAAVTDKGVTTAADAAFATIANNISSLQTGGSAVYDNYGHYMNYGGLGGIMQSVTISTGLPIGVKSYQFYYIDLSVCGDGLYVWSVLDNTPDWNTVLDISKDTFTIDPLYDVYFEYDTSGSRMRIQSFCLRVEKSNGVYNIYNHDGTFIATTDQYLGASGIAVENGACTGGATGGAYLVTKIST